MIMQELLRGSIEKAVHEICGKRPHADFSLEFPEDPAHGEYATNAALVYAKTLGRQPHELAEKIAVHIRAHMPQGVERVEIAGPGFINFYLSQDSLLRGVAHVLKEGDRWGVSRSGEGKTVMVEYFQLNIAKRPHVGHLRSAVIGDALKRMLLNAGYHAVSDTHVGDWGTQFGILLYAYKKLDFEEQKKIEKDPFNKFDELYIAENSELEVLRKKVDSFHQRIYNKGDIPVDIDEVKEFQNAQQEYFEKIELRRREFAQLEKGDPENRKIWEWMVEVSMKKLEESAGRLHLIPFDEHKGESSYEADMPGIVEEALAKGVAIKKDGGAVIVDLTQDELDEAVLIKSDGASTYLLRDLATIKYRKARWNFWKNLYVVDVRQAHHFKQLFRVAELLGIEGAEESEHVEFGFMKLPEGAISTRKGTAIALEKLLDEAEKRAREIIQEKNPNLEHMDEVARVVGLGAVKFFDLSHHRRSDVTLDWERVLSFEGDTGPYLQYTYARLASILRKAGDVRSPTSDIELADLERKLLVTILRFPEAIEGALAVWSPHVLASYLYALAQTANEFYHAYPVTQESDEVKRRIRLALVSAAATTLKNGLMLLGIPAPERM